MALETSIGKRYKGALNPETAHPKAKQSAEEYVRPKAQTQRSESTAHRLVGALSTWGGVWAARLNRKKCIS